MAGRVGEFAIENKIYGRRKCKGKGLSMTFGLKFLKVVDGHPRSLH